MPLHADLCSRLHNAALARIRSVPIPSTTSNQQIASILLSHGFIHNVVRGTITGPSPSEWNKASAARRRLWVDLKFANDDRPVLSEMKPVSKPSRRIAMTAEELLRLSTGRRAKFVQPLGLGEIAIVDCGKDGWCEAREAIKRNLGGEVIARVS